MNFKSTIKKIFEIITWPFWRTAMAIFELITPKDAALGEGIFNICLSIVLAFILVFILILVLLIPILALIN